MLALRLDGSTPVLDATAPVPEPAEGEALVRVRRAAITGLELAVCRGLNAFDGILGHAFAGTVERVRGGRRELVGQRVAAASVVACGTCDRCTAGLAAHCAARAVPGVLGRDGGIAEFVALPVRSLVPVPSGVDDDAAAFAAPLAAAIQAAQQIALKGKPYVTVLGDGRLGLLAGQVMARLNASVRVVGRHAEKMSVCERWGLKHRHVDEVGRRADQDVVVDCTGSAAGLETAVRMVRPRGTVLVKSLLPAAEGALSPEVLERVVLGELSVVGSSAGPVSEALGMLARREVDVVSLISRRVPLRDAVTGLRHAAQPEALGVLVACSDAAR